MVEFYSFTHTCNVAYTLRRYVSVKYPKSKCVYIACSGPLNTVASVGDLSEPMNFEISKVAPTALAVRTSATVSLMRGVYIHPGRINLV